MKAIEKRQLINVQRIVLEQMRECDLKYEAERVKVEKDQNDALRNLAQKQGWILDEINILIKELLELNN